MSWESEDTATPDPEEYNENKTEWLALVAPATKFIFAAVVAVAEFPVTFPVKFPEKVEAVNISVDGL